MLKTLYVCYVETDVTEPGTFLYLPDKAAYEEAQTTGATFPGARKTLLHQMSGLLDDPTIEILAFTPTRLGQERAETIGQKAIDWLMDNGHLPKR